MKNKKTTIRVGLVGAGCMGRGIAAQINLTKGMELSWIADLDGAAAESAAALTSPAKHGTDFEALIGEHPIDVLVEATNSIEAAYHLSLIHI